jgi:taurine---2-oxoglutarate transaminase
MTEISTECRKRGLLPFITSNRIHVVPPCNVSEEHVRSGLEILDACTMLGAEPPDQG